MDKEKKQVLNEYIAFRNIECKSVTIKDYEREITKFFNYLKNKKLSDITESDLTTYVNHISNKYKQNSLNTIKPLLKNFIKWYYSDYSSRFRNLDRICKIKKAEPTYRPEQMLTENEIKKIVESENDLFWKVFHLIFFYGGFRPIEASRLKWNDVQFENDGSIIIKSYSGKNKKLFYKNLPAEVTPLIHKWKELNHDEYVFPSPTKANTPIHQKTPHKHITRVSEKVLGRKINPYIIRHSLATIKYNDDSINDELTANQLGHHKSMKETYAHYNEDALIKKAKKVWTNKNEMPVKLKKQLEERIENQGKEIEKLKELFNTLLIETKESQKMNFELSKKIDEERKETLELLSEHKKKIKHTLKANN